MKDTLSLFKNYPYKKYQNRIQHLDEEKLSLFFSDRFQEKKNKILSEKGIASLTKMEKFSRHMGFDISLLGDIISYEDKQSHYEYLLDEVLKLMDGGAGSIVVAKEPIDNSKLCNALINRSFYYVCGETVFSLDMSKLKTIESVGFENVRVATKNDERRIKELSHHAHGDIRYYFDDNFDRTKVGGFYEETACDTIESHSSKCFVYEDSGVVEGFITVIYNKGLSGIMGMGYCSLDYISVNPEVQKKGIGYILNNYALQHLKDSQYRICVVKTMASNYRAIALLIKNEFLITGQNLVYHYKKSL